MAIPDKFEVWVVDTKAANFELVVNSVPDSAHLILRHMPSAEEFLEQLRKRASDFEKSVPQIILIDFFLGETFANDIIPQINEMFEFGDPYRKPYIVAFSSMPNANTALLDIGAQWDILKIKDAEKIKEIEDLLGSKDAIVKHLGLTA